jgi:hypothetical protein
VSQTSPEPKPDADRALVPEAELESRGGPEPETPISDEAGDLIQFLERDQLTTGRSRPLPPARLGARAQMALWALRIFALVVGVLVVYTFVVTLQG